MAHSKRNTSLAFFTSHERNMLKNSWGSQSTHLTRESFLPFGSCQLCLLPAVDPVACASHGDLFCRECAVSNLLAQRKEMKRLERVEEERKKEAEELETIEDDEAHEEAIRRFEDVQRGLEERGGGKVVGRSDGQIIIEKEAPDADNKTPSAAAGTKRKFEIDEEELLRIARDDRKAARQSLSSKAAAAKTPLPSFWLPSQTPTADPAASASTRRTPTCPSSPPDNPHILSLKTLISVHFHTESTSTSTPSGKSSTPPRLCPSCLKTLSNASKPLLAVPCGHVLCKPCGSKFMNKERRVEKHEVDAKEGEVRCYVCEADLTAKKSKKDKKEKEGKVRPGLVEMNTEGTGFAGGGKSVVKKEGVVFQC